MSDEYGYAGNAEFEACDEAVKSTVEDWQQSAKNDFEMLRFTALVLRLDDKQLEKYARTLGETDEECAHTFMEFCDWVQAHKTRYEDGVKVMEAMAARLNIIADRLRGRQDRYLH